MSVTRTCPLCLRYTSALDHTGMTERSASVSSVSDFVSVEAFEGQAVVSENLMIPDTVVTRGRSMHCINA